MKSEKLVYAAVAFSKGPKNKQAAVIVLEHEDDIKQPVENLARLARIKG